MADTYTILRVNQSEGTITVMLSSDGHELQQDIDVVDFSDAQAIESSIIGHLGKLKSDLVAVTPTTEIAPEIQTAIEQEAVIAVTSQEIADNPLPVPEVIAPAPDAQPETPSDNQPQAG